MTLRLVHSSPEPDASTPAPALVADDGFSILGAVRLPGSGMAVDDVLVGPSGIYAVVRKRLAGRVRVSRDGVTVNGMERDAITEHVRSFGEALRRLVLVEFGDVPVPVVPVVCVSGFEPSRNASVGGVRLLSDRGLARALRKAPRALTRRDVEALTCVLRTRLALA